MNNGTMAMTLKKSTIIKMQALRRAKSKKAYYIPLNVKVLLTISFDCAS